MGLANELLLLRDIARRLPESRDDSSNNHTDSTTGIFQSIGTARIRLSEGRFIEKACHCQVIKNFLDGFLKTNRVLPRPSRKVLS